VQYITRQEARRVNAVRNNKPRELTQVENILLAGVALTKKDRYDISELNQLCMLMRDSTGGERLADKLKEAVVNPEAMQALIEVYPHVEFNAVIKAGTEALNVFERLSLANYHYYIVEGLGEALVEFYALLEEMPKGIETFIYTPFTELYALRAQWEANKAEKLYLGYVLNPLTQGSLKSIVRYQAYANNALLALINTGLLNNDDLWRRIKKTKPQSDFELSWYESQKFSRNGTVLVATNNKTNTKLHFCV
jgi:hypothetical protein